MRRSHQLPLLFLSLLLFVSPRGFASDAEPSPRPEASERHRFVLLAGATQIFDTDIDPLYGFEFQPAWRWHGIGSWFSLVGGEDAGIYSAIGLLYDFRIGARWRVTPSFGVGYFRAHDFDLGSDLEFRSRIELSREFDNGWRLGLGLSHVSNGSIGDINPGSEALCGSLSIPVF